MRQAEAKKTSAAQGSAWRGSSAFGIVLGLSSLGQGWRLAARLWGMPNLVGEAILLVAGAVWAWLLATMLVQAVRQPAALRAEIEHPVSGVAPALIGIATLLVGIAIVPYSWMIAASLIAAGIAWHLVFTLWHTGDSWMSGRDETETAPNIYLPTVAGNFTSGGALGALGFPEWGWLFLGAGLFSWLALESIVLRSLWMPHGAPQDRRALIGIHFAPPAVMGMAWLLIDPGEHDRLLLMLWGYALFQLILGVRLVRWLAAQPLGLSYWSYTFGLGSTGVISLNLALTGNSSAYWLAPIVFATVNLFVFGLVATVLTRALRRVTWKRSTRSEGCGSPDETSGTSSPAATAPTDPPVSSG